MSHSLPKFILSDQFGREMTDSAFSGVPLIVVVGNRAGAAGVARWTAALRAVIGDSSDTSVLPVADLRGVPRLLRRTIARLLPRDPEHWCALDWDGALAADIRSDKTVLAAAAFDARSQLRAKLILPVDSVDSKRMTRLVEAAEGL